MSNTLRRDMVFALRRGWAGAGTAGLIAGLAGPQRSPWDESELVLVDFRMTVSLQSASFFFLCV